MPLPGFFLINVVITGLGDVQGPKSIGPSGPSSKRRLQRIRGPPIPASGLAMCPRDLWGPTQNVNDRQDDVRRGRPRRRRDIAAGSHHRFHGRQDCTAAIPVAHLWRWPQPSVFVSLLIV